MSNTPTNLQYSRTHEWIELNENGTARIGITHHAQDLLGDIVFIELPEIGQKISAEDTCGVIESVKAASDLYSPLSGEIVETNSMLSDSPELVNQNPYHDGWIYIVKLSDKEELENLLSSTDYEKFATEEEH